MPLRNGETFAGFRLIRLLGSGGMGEVYLVEHPRLPRRDALKILPADLSADDEYRARFNREADLASTLWHPHIMSVRRRGRNCRHPGHDSLAGQRLTIAALLDRWHQAVGPGGTSGTPLPFCRC